MNVDIVVSKSQTCSLAFKSFPYAHIKRGKMPHLYGFEGAIAPAYIQRGERQRERERGKEREREREREFPCSHTCMYTYMTMYHRLYGTAWTCTPSVLHVHTCIVPPGV